MTPTLRRKLEALAERREELERLLADPDVIGDGDRFRAFSREFAQLEPLATAMAEEKRARADLTAAQAMREDPELAELADEEITAAQQRLAQLDEQLMLLLLPKDSRDEGNLFLEKVFEANQLVKLNVTKELPSSVSVVSRPLSVVRCQ